MKFELHFNKDVYNKQMDLLSDLIWKNKIAYYKNSQYFGVILIVIGIVLIYNRPNIFGIGYGFVFFGLTNFTPFIYYYIKIKLFYKKRDDAKVNGIECANSVGNVYWEFTENAFIESVDDYLNVIEWTEFLQYLILENNLIMITKEYHPYVLDEIEIGQESFEKVISFVKTKLEVRE